MRAILPLLLLMLAADPPAQAPEGLPPIRTIELLGKQAGAAAQFTPSDPKRLTLLVILNDVQRGSLPLAGLLDQYAQDRPDQLRAAIVIMTPDRQASLRELPAAVEAAALISPILLAAEGFPDAYKLDKSKALSLLLIRGGAIEKTVALREPALDDAADLVGVVGKAIKDPFPPTPADLRARRTIRLESARHASRPSQITPDANQVETATNEQLRQVVGALKKEVAELKKRVKELEQKAGR